MASTVLCSSGSFLTRAADLCLERSADTFSVGSVEAVRVTSTPAAQHSNKLYEKSLKKITTPTVPGYKWDIVWKNVLLFLILHSMALYGILLMVTHAKGATLIFFLFYSFLNAFGITAGAHRLWTHRTYRAKLPLEIFLMMCQSTALQNTIYEWARDHRVHHKFTDTDADPHNSRRGFFFSHMGWLLVKKHKDVFIKGKTVDMSDLEANPVVKFQIRYYIPLVILFCFVIPSVIPWYFWGEDGWVSFYVVGIARFTLSLHCTWSVNSAAHIYGNKPYDKTINPTNNRFVSVVAFGEGWHNYHHVFPWDYKTAELGNYRLNFTSAFLDVMAKIGLAYDLKTASPEIIKKRALRTGDGNWVDNSSGNITKNVDVEIDDHDHHHLYDDAVWGWGDKDLTEDEIKNIKCYNKLTE